MRHSTRIIAALMASTMIFLMYFPSNLNSMGLIIFLITFSVTYMLVAISSPILTPISKLKSNLISGLLFIIFGLFWGTILSMFAKQGYFNHPGTLWRDINADYIGFLVNNCEFPLVAIVSSFSAWLHTRHLLKISNKKRNEMNGSVEPPIR